MMIIGCDFHPSWQPVSWVDTETGECGERKLVHATGEAKVFYQQVAAPALIGMEATGNSQWFIERVEDLGHAIWIGDAAQIRASYVRKQKTDKRDAAHILKLVVERRFPRLWTPDREQRDLRQLVLHRHAVNGVVSPSQSLAPLVINQGQLIPANPTTTIQTQTNLDASAAVGTSFSTPITVFDSLGTSHVLTYQFTKTASNVWSYNITPPAADTGGAGAPTVVSTGNVTFNPDGTLATPAAPVTGIAITGLADGAANLNVTWNLQDANGNSLLTQSSAPSATANTFQNGYGSGTLSDFSITSDGTIEGSFTNNQTLALGQIVLANFANPQGLLRLGENSFQTTLSSGAPAIGTAGSGGRGTITKSQANNLVGADLTKAATDLTKATTAHDAALVAAAKILPTSLLDYLR